MPLLLAQSANAYRLHNRATNVKALTLSSYRQSLQSYIAHWCCGQLSAVKTGYPLTSITGQVMGSCTGMYLGLRCRVITNLSKRASSLALAKSSHYHPTMAF